MDSHQFSILIGHWTVVYWFVITVVKKSCFWFLHFKIITLQFKLFSCWKTTTFWPLRSCGLWIVRVVHFITSAYGNVRTSYRTCHLSELTGQTQRESIVNQPCSVRRINFLNSSKHLLESYWKYWQKKHYLHFWIGWSDQSVLSKWKAPITTNSISNKDK